MRSTQLALIAFALCLGCASRPRLCEFGQLSKEIVDLAALNPPAYGVVAGRVIGDRAELHPAIGVRLVVVSTQQARSGQITTADGEFAFYQVPAETPLRLEIESYGFRPQRSNQFLLSPGQKIAFCFHLRGERGETITKLQSRKRALASRRSNWP